MSETEIRHADGRVELRDPGVVAGSPLFNHDLAPVAVKDRTWNTWDYGALWVSMAHCIPTYTLASGMIAAGMAWWQALLTILVGNLIVLVPILLNSHPGTKYGIPFPVFARAAYGTYGANFPALMRAIVACGWFGINAWFGGLALQTFFVTLWPGWATLLGTIHGEAGTVWVSFLLFWGLNILVIFKGMDVLRRVERWAAPYVLVMTAILVGWAIWRAGGLGPILSRTSFDESAAHTTLWAVLIPSLTGTIAFWSTLSLNMPDFTRFGRSQREQVVGQSIALPSTMTVFAAMGIVITSASAVIYGKPVWNPIDLASHFSSRIVVGIATFTAVIATLAVNIAANVVSPANDFANAFPKRINFKIGGLITGILGIAMMPWELVKDAHRYLDGWLGGYGGALGTVAGVLIVDYWIIRKKELDLHSLYSVDGIYRYRNGWNTAAVVATLGGMFCALPGAFIHAFAPLYQWSWFVGFFVAGALYWLQMRTSTPRPTVSVPEATVVR
ncbi:MAG: NCS1 family nucleobase:cation symporter-1 [Deltaproteobacteria bacterium]|nr:NCS1 family nucleobase:cation symporter-1 [Deltaproteobacteria bacterium]